MPAKACEPTRAPIGAVVTETLRRNCAAGTMDAVTRVAGIGLIARFGTMATRLGYDAAPGCCEAIGPVAR